MLVQQRVCVKVLLAVTEMFHFSEYTVIRADRSFNVVTDTRHFS